MAEFAQMGSKKKDTARCTMYGIGWETPPVFIVKQATEENKPYFNEFLRHAEHLAKRKQKVNVDVLRATRDRDRESYPRHVIVGWENVVSPEGVAIPFSVEACARLLNGLDWDVFDDLRDFCRDTSNFKEVMDGSAAAGNSQTG